MKTVAMITMAASTASCAFIRVSDNLIEKLDAKGGLITADGNLTVKNYDIQEFSTLKVSLPCDIKYTQGENSLSISASANIIDIINVDCSDNVLSISSSETLRRPGKITVYLSSENLTAINIKGAADFSSEGSITSDKDFTIEVNGAGDIDINHLKAANIDILVNGAGDIDLDVIETGTLAMEINGAGDADIKNLNCTTVTAELNGAGDCEIKGKADNANISVSGAGSIDVRNLACTNKNTSVRGVGSIKK